MTATIDPATDPNERYTIISSDCHAGANHATYREYLSPEWRDEFDAWRDRYKNPFRDLQDDGRTRNWDDARRLPEEEQDGVVAEVVFPNTVPPFFPTGVVIAQAPSPEDYPARLEGIRTHNRWLVDFCAAQPDRRRGVGQLLLNNVEDSLEDVRWIKDHGLASVLLPGVAPGGEVPPLFDPVYEPLWQLCAELDLPVTHHGGGSGQPDYGDHPWSQNIWLIEVPFFANRALWHLTMSGVFERNPELIFVMTEQGSTWIPGALASMESAHFMSASGKFGEIGPSQYALKEQPTEYFKRNVFVGSSFPSKADAKVFQKLGLDNFMWGSDYPHREGSWPYTREQLRRSFEGWAPTDLKQIFSENIAKIYKFDLDKLAPFGAQFGPTVAELRVPLDEIPPQASSPGFYR